MSKDNSIIHIDSEKHHAAKEQVIPLELLICSWKNEFSLHECKVMIAEALNYCVYRHRMKIAGYLVTKRRLCLVLKIEEQHLEEMLQHFYRELRKEIRQRLQLREEIRKDLETLLAEGKPTSLFIQYPLQNYMLIRLITGRSVYLPYYSPYLARLTDKINMENFCSAVDYSGAKGPVVVKKLKPHEFDDGRQLVTGAE